MFSTYTGSLNADIDAFLKHEDMEEARLPKCGCCGERIYADSVRYEGELVCEECFLAYTPMEED